MSTIFVTGATGYLGGYVLDELLRRSDATLAVLTRAADAAQGKAKLWRALQMHQDIETFRSFLPRIELVQGDLLLPNLGIDDAIYKRLTREVESVLHIAASLNRKSSKACFNANLRGALSVIQFGRAVADDHGLRRFGYVSTVAVAGIRNGETVHEDTAVEWDRSDYDPYARTKKFGEHMLAELLPDVDRVIFRPSIVMGDSRDGRTSQFDMVGALITLADVPIVPLRRSMRLDIVAADYVGEAIARIHLSEEPVYPIYHLSSGEQSVTAGGILDTLAPALRIRPLLIPAMGRPFEWTFKTLDSLPRGTAQRIGATMKVFWPYITFDTVFDNTRVTETIGRPPPLFSSYGEQMYRFAKKVGFKYPYTPLPEGDA